MKHTQKNSIGSVKLNSSHPLAQGLTACWLFNEGAGDILYDSTGRNSRGDPVGNITRKVSRFGRSLGFNGSGQYVNLGVNKQGLQLNGATKITLAAMVNPSAWPGSGVRGRVVSIPINNSVVGLILGFYSNAGRIDAAARSVNTDTLQVAGTVTYPALNEWHLMAMVADFPNDTISIYIDGVHKITTAVTFANTSYTQGTPTSLYEALSSNGASADYYTGDIGSVYVYRRGLNEKEMFELFVNPYSMFNSYSQSLNLSTTGTLVETIGGLAIASVETIAGLPIASVKTIAGLAL